MRTLALPTRAMHNALARRSPRQHARHAILPGSGARRRSARVQTEAPHCDPAAAAHGLEAAMNLRRERRQINRLPRRTLGVALACMMLEAMGESHVGIRIGAIVVADDAARAGRSRSPPSVAGASRAPPVDRITQRTDVRCSWPIRC